MMASKERILLKISGGALSSAGETYDEQKLLDLASQIKDLQKNYDVGIVIGGGNICRGRERKIKFLSSFYRDYMGMASTVLNGFVLQGALSYLKVKSRLFSSLEIERISEKINLSEVEKTLNSGEVVIFSGGLGEPCFSTDSAAFIRAIEIRATKVLIGKSGVKGVYNRDPKSFLDAEFQPSISYDRLISEDIRILDLPSLLLAKENNLTLLIFNQEENLCFIKALRGEIDLSIVR
ncbi:hypothetical protein PVNG_02434 [Plasmodium vivax North Korean]|uniref:Uridylate kinase n=1 Tax=Plasmodium vivax North Korean TaxID=1035514 RepID=A0A0J9TMA7_PLAVI|nr:hypothetical protein PVNG_02434 [Plasmodium vivax North Korean]